MGEAEGKKEGSLHGRNFVAAYMDERSLLKEGGADHQPLLRGPSYELPTEADKRTADHFNPRAFRQVVAGFHRGTGRRHLLKHGDLFSRDRFRFDSADNAHDTRRLENGKTRVQGKVGKAIAAE